MANGRHLWLNIGESRYEGLEFDRNKAFSGCKICGALFQSSLDRSEEDLTLAMLMRKQWSHQHASEHSDREHLKLAMSGAWATPIAAERLASYGIVALSDMILFDESESALLGAKSIPIREVEGESVLRNHL